MAMLNNQRVTLLGNRFFMATMSCVDDRHVKRTAIRARNTKW